jgi:hypothetical protein
MNRKVCKCIFYTRFAAWEGTTSVLVFVVVWVWNLFCLRIALQSVASSDNHPWKANQTLSYEFATDAEYCTDLDYIVTVILKICDNWLYFGRISFVQCTMSGGNRLFFFLLFLVYLPLLQLNRSGLKSINRLGCDDDYEETGTIIVLYTSIFRFLYRTWDDKDSELSDRKHFSDLICLQFQYWCHFVIDKTWLTE